MGLYHNFGAGRNLPGLGRGFQLPGAPRWLPSRDSRGTAPVDGADKRCTRRYNAGMTSEHWQRPPPPSGLHHLALGARDVERLAAFYTMAFGLREVSRQRDAEGALRSIWLELESSLLMIEHTARQRAVVQDVDAGLFLIAFRIECSERLDFVSRLAAHGHLVESTTEYTSYFRDPEGNRFAVSSYPTESRT